MCETDVKISVLMPNYNDSEYLPRALESVLPLQMYLYEFVICDDASTDNSWEILLEYQKKYPIIKLIRNEKNLGVIGSSRRLMREANGNFITHVSADDEWIPEKIEILLKKIHEQPEVAMFCGKTVYYYEKMDAYAWDSGQIKSGVYSDILSSIRYNVPWGVFGVFYRKDIITALWEEALSLEVYCDTFVNLLIAQNHAIFFLNQSIGKFRFTGDNFNLKAHTRKYQWYILPKIFTLIQNDHPELYKTMVSSKLFCQFFGVAEYIICHPRMWNRDTWNIVFAAPFYRQAYIPYIPDFLMKIYRKIRYRKSI